MLRQDRGNFAVLLWKGMDGYDEIFKAAKQFKNKMKGASSKKDIKTARKTYLEKQANRVVRSYKSWIDSRKEEY